VAARNQEESGGREVSIRIVTHDFVMLNALRGTQAAQAAISQTV